MVLKNPKVLGIVNFLLPVPMAFMTIVWAVAFTLVIGPSITPYEVAPPWVLAVDLLPLLISPALSIYGILFGIKQRSEPNGTFCIVLSSIALLINAVIIFALIYFGSTL